jgi:hypothetical protein
MRASFTVRGLLAAAFVTFSAASLSAQPFGTFTWQMQPYCNQVTLTLTNVTGNFTLDGSDNMCAAPKKASASGIGVFNPDGTVGLNFTIVLPTGRSVGVAASVSPANGQGTWTDTAGNSGTFAFFGSTPGLPARPAPASLVRFRASNVPKFALATSTETPILWQTVAYNVGGGTYTPATGIYVVPEGGTYLITASMEFDGTAATGLYCLAPAVAGSEIQWGCHANSAVATKISSVSSVHALATGDAVTLRVWQSSGGAQQVGSTSAANVHFSITRLQ